MQSAAEPFELAIAIEASDIDQLGHVNNVTYLRWVQDVAVAHWMSRAPAASLRTLTGKAHDRAELLATLLERLEARYDQWRRGGLAPLVPELDRRDALRGREVRVGELAGTADGIARDGRLRLTQRDGTTALVASGEVEPAA